MKKASIVIPNYNGEKLLQKNLPQIISAIDKNTEIIVVDDASTDGSVMMLLKKFPTIKIIQHETNLRFGAACNSGVKETQAEIVILLNSDVIPVHGFIEKLISHFDDSKVFSVGCKEIENINGQQIVSGRTEGKIVRGLLVHHRPSDQESIDTLWNFGGSMAVNKKKYLQLGGFDKLFAPAYWEDIDLSFRAKKKGWLVLFEKDAIVYHNHETTNKKIFGSNKLKILSFRNQILFAWKNFNKQQLKQHFLWLPYHLIFTSIRSKGLFLLAFIQAVIKWVIYKKENQINSHENK